MAVTFVRESASSKSVAMCCSVLQCAAVCCSDVGCVAVLYVRERECAVEECCSVLQCVAVRCSVLQCYTATTPMNSISLSHERTKPSWRANRCCLGPVPTDPRPIYEYIYMHMCIYVHICINAYV